MGNDRTRTSAEGTLGVSARTSPGQRRSVRPKKGSNRRLAGTAGLVAFIAVTCILTLGFLGNEAPVKFSEVGSAVDGGGGGGAYESAGVAPRAAPGAPATIPRPARVADPADGDVGSGRPADASLLAFPLIDPSRSFISSATLQVEVDDVGATAQEAVLAVEAAGGALFAETSSYRGRAEATLTFKVPPTEFRPSLTRLGRLGTVVEQTVSTDDVTERVIDVDSRVATARRSVDRTRGYLAEAASPGDIASFEDQLRQAESQLETLLGQQRTLENQVDLATIVFTVSAPLPTTTPDPAAIADLADPAPDEPSELPGFLDGLRSGWASFTAVGSVALAGVGLALPWLPVLGAGYLVVRFARWWTARRPRAAGATA